MFCQKSNQSCCPTVLKALMESRPFSLFSSLRDVGIGCLCFLGTCLALHSMVPQPTVPVVTPKLDYFSKHSDSYNAVFVGSSRICHGISPAIFDEAMRAQGFDIKSFNFGVDGMFPPESFAVLERLLAVRSSKLKWVFIELTPIHPGTHGNKSLRASWWHDYTQTQWELRYAVDNFRLHHLVPVTNQLYEHLQLFALNHLNLGHGVNLLTPEYKAEPFGAQEAGFLPLAGTHFKSAKQSKEYKIDIEKMTHPLKPHDPDSASIAAFENLAGVIEQHGLTPIFVIPPTAYGAEDFLAAQPIPHSTFAFADPVKFPQLYQVNRRYDCDHLNRTGAEEFTRMLASEFGAFLSRNKPPRLLSGPI